MSHSVRKQDLRPSGHAILILVFLSQVNGKNAQQTAEVALKRVLYHASLRVFLCKLEWIFVRCVAMVTSCACLCVYRCVHRGLHQRFRPSRHATRLLARHPSYGQSNPLGLSAHPVERAPKLDLFSVCKMGCLLWTTAVVQSWTCPAPHGPALLKQHVNGFHRPGQLAVLSATVVSRRGQSYVQQTQRQ